jgi:hypothetical protein
MRAALDARASTHEQQALGMRADAVAAGHREPGQGWRLGAKDRPGRESLLNADFRGG